jgi:hypothetical protein
MAMAQTAREFSGQVNLAGRDFYDWVNQAMGRGNLPGQPGFVGPPRPGFGDRPEDLMHWLFPWAGGGPGVNIQFPEGAGGAIGGAAQMQVMQAYLLQIATLMQQQLQRPVVEMQPVDLP